MGRLRLFGELIEAGGEIETGGEGGGGACQVARAVVANGDYQTADTSFTDIDAANLSLQLTTEDGWVLLLLAGSAYIGLLQYCCFDFTIDGQRQGQVKGVQQLQASYFQDVQIAWLAQVQAGTHTFRPQWRVTGSSAVLRAGASETPLLFAVIVI